MTIVNYITPGKGVRIQCDTCEKEFPDEPMPFDYAWAQAKNEGWKAEKVGKDWVHGCPDCGV